MPSKVLAKFMRLNSKQRIFLGIVAILILFVIFAITRSPERSVTAYCRVYTQENSKLPHDGGDKYSAGIFTSSINDPGKFASAYSKLEQVAPEEIMHDVKTLKSVFEKMDSDPSQALAASLSGLGAQMNVKDWTKNHCQSDYQ